MRYYRANLKKLPLSLAWRWRDPMTLVGLLIIRARSGPAYGDDVFGVPGIEGVDEKDCDADLLHRLRPGIAEFEAADFHLLGYHRSWVKGEVRALAAQLLSEDGDTIGQVMYSETPMVSDLIFACLSWRHDDTVVATATRSKGMPEPPFVSGAEVRNKDVGAVVEKHRKRVSNLEVRSLTPSEVLPLLGSLADRSVEYGLRQGWYEYTDPPRLEDEAPPPA